MRKKAHRRINAKNHEYDRFYVINYLVKPSDTLATRFPVRINEAVLASINVQLAKRNIASVEANTLPECIIPILILKRPSCSVRNWERRGRRCRAKMTVSWRTMRMSKFPHVAP